jgi:hypothetical protein
MHRRISEFNNKARVSHYIYVGQYFQKDKDGKEDKEDKDTSEIFSEKNKNDTSKVTEEKELKKDNTKIKKKIQNKSIKENED